MKEKIAIIGANEAITMLINKAKDMGYETHVFAWQCGDPGEKEADYFYPISINKKEEILEMCREIGIVGICSITSDYASPTVNYVARNMGLICNPESSEYLARDKYLMRKAFKDNGIYTPQFIEVEKLEEVDLSGFEYPLIVKPTDRWSSKGVCRVNSYAELKEAIDIAVNESFNKKAIVEEFIYGDEYSAECICQNGEYHIIAFTKKFTTGYPHYIETGHIQPVTMLEDAKEVYSQTLFKALKALNIYNGAAHIEFKIMKDGEIGIIEIGARMGGDCIGTYLTQLSSGMDYIKMVIDVACGKKLVLTPAIEKRCVGIRFILDESDLNDLRALSDKKIIKKVIYDYDFSRDVVDSNTRHGYYIMELEDEKSCSIWQ